MTDKQDQEKAMGSLKRDLDYSDSPRGVASLSNEFEEESSKDESFVQKLKKIKITVGNDPTIHIDIDYGLRVGDIDKDDLEEDVSLNNGSEDGENSTRSYVVDVHSESSSESESAAIHPVFNNGGRETIDFIATRNRSRYCAVESCGEDVYENGVAFLCQQCERPCCSECYPRTNAQWPFCFGCQAFVCPRCTWYNTCNYCASFVCDLCIDTGVCPNWQYYGCGCNASIVGSDGELGNMSEREESAAEASDGNESDRSEDAMASDVNSNN